MSDVSLWLCVSLMILHVFICHLYKFFVGISVLFVVLLQG